MPKEIWKSIRGYTGFYEISNKGRVRSLDRIISDKNGHKRRIKARMLTLHPHNSNSFTVTLSKKCKHRGYTIAQLKAKAFK
jgi:hypothetical protein